MTATFALIAAVVFVSAFVQGSTSMGFALILVPVLALLRPDMIPGALLYLMLPLNAYVALRERRDIDFHGAGWITFGRLFGTFAGLWVLLILSSYWLNMVVGISTILAVAASLLAPEFTPGRKALALTGLVTGITETATGIGGPPLALAYQHAPVSRLRSTVALCFLVGEVISLIVLAVSGSIGLKHLEFALWCSPALLAGMLASHLVHERLNQRALRLGVLLFAAISGVVVILAQ